MNIKKVDNRMGLIRNFEKLTNLKDNPENYWVNYEIATEQRITGLLDYEGYILGGLIVSPEDKLLNNKLYSYTLRMKFPQIEPPYYRIAANKNGYFFPAGPIGELLSLLSLHYGIRFYQISTTQGELSEKSIPLRTQYNYVYFPAKPTICPDVLEQINNINWGSAKTFLDKTKTLVDTLHFPFIMACNLYLRGLREINVDAEMFFIRMVSSIEAITERLSENEFKRIIGVNKGGKQYNFISFFNRFDKGFYKGGKYKARHCRIAKKDAPERLKAIYDARSRYLHEGESMYLSQIAGYKSWDMDPSQGMFIDNKKYTSEQKLPYISWFQRLVRHCLLNFFNENS